jgi:hypothetical protein
MRIGSVVALAAAGLAIAATATGITYAATSTDGSVRACANSKGTLRLLDPHGNCPANYSKVSISKRGPKGKPGATGPRGKQGVAGPGAVRLAVSSTSGLKTKETARIAGTTLTVEVLCNPADNAQVYVSLDHAGAPFTFEGMAGYVGMGSGSVLYQDPTSAASNESQNLTDRTAEVSASQLGDPHSVEFSSMNGIVAANLVLAQGSRMFSVQLGAFHSDDSCWAHAMVIPAG